MLSATMHLASLNEMLRFAQHDKREQQVDNFHSNNADNFQIARNT